MIYVKLIESSKCTELRELCFESIQKLPRYRIANDLPEMDHKFADILFAAYLLYYEDDLENENIIRCFEGLSN